MTTLLMNDENKKIIEMVQGHIKLGTPIEDAVYKIHCVFPKKQVTIIRYIYNKELKSQKLFDKHDRAAFDFVDPMRD